ncbi:MAG: hypothetical protein ACR2QZ_07820, partial [Woeseiaceae bacterium]
IGAWVAIQVAAQFFASWGIPESSVRYVWIAAFLCFPVALIFSWRYDVSISGISKSPQQDTQSENQALDRRDHVILSGMGVPVIAILTFCTLSIFQSRNAIDDTRIPGIANAPEKSVAVLAFEDLSPTGDHEWFADGITEEIINSLAQLPELKTTARKSAFFFKDKSFTVPEIAARLGVRYVVEGSMRRIVDELRITYQVIRASDGFNVYSDAIDHKVEDVFEAQQEVAVRIADALEIVLDGERRNAMFALGTRDFDAYVSYLQGRHLVHKWLNDENINDLWAATDLFSDAIASDPKFSNAYLYRAHNYKRYIETNWGPSDPDEQLTPGQIHQRLLSDYADASQYTDEPAIRLISDLSSMLFSDDFRDLRRLAGQFDPAVAAAVIPDGLDIFHVIAMLLIADQQGVAGQYADARIERNPLDSLGYNQAYVATSYAGDRQRAIKYLERAREATTDSVFTEFNFLMSSILAGQWNEASRLAEIPGWGIDEFREPILAILYSVTGRTAEARAITDKLGREKIFSTYYALALKETGEVENARVMIEAIDASPVGNLEGLFFLGDFAGDMPVDLGWMPNFSARLSEAGVTVGTFKFEKTND